VSKSWAGHALVVNTPADRRALVDLLMYMEKNFNHGSILGARPAADNAPFAAEDREIRQAGTDVMKCRRRIHKRRDRQRLMTYRRRLRR
jgi:hypothetical protein